MKLCHIYRQPGELPDLSSFAQGAFTLGYSNELFSPMEFRGPGVGEVPNLVAVSGGRGRLEGRNGAIIAYFVALGVPSIICEFGRLVAGTQLLLLNEKPWVPDVVPAEDRTEKLGLIEDIGPRGENILVCGQRPDLDRKLEDAVSRLKAATGRKVVYRPHPNAWRLPVPEYEFPGADEISSEIDRFGPDSIPGTAQRSLARDLDNAWCVVTHSSIIPITAALRGIPSFATKDCAGHEICTPLDECGFVEPRVFTGTRLEHFLHRFAYTIWFEEEIRLGRAMAFLMEKFQ